MDKRFRKFRIPYSWLDEGIVVVANFMMGMVVVEASGNLPNKCIEYTAWHPDFPLLEPDAELKNSHIELVKGPKADPTTGIILDNVVVDLRFKEEKKVLALVVPEEEAKGEKVT